MIQDTKYKLTIGWLYPELMSTYGDRGNINVLTKRCEWRGIRVDILNLSVGFDIKLLKNINLLFMGGAEDIQQQIVAKDFTVQKIKALKKKVEDGTPGLYICGALQFLGKYYKDASGTKIKGLGIFDLHTEHPGAYTKRFIGNIVTRSDLASPIVGFENHG